ncbi:hypothetical protein T265_12092 [Opisthorchis viverrini]|uniref:Uncharacterized protein n=1 Tax=Opisthorchis viverrini TaxID=6198 RepID=A0A074ZUQ5_OPIVI|nr:hypothetical protein T265_12092 [Opisthorchis viverrini]KER18939.1 hypothetical protein T265_12092 [Opisthorchis viverrini]
MLTSDVAVNNDVDAVVGKRLSHYHHQKFSSYPDGATLKTPSEHTQYKRATVTTMVDRYSDCHLLLPVPACNILSDRTKLSTFWVTNSLIDDLFLHLSSALITVIHMATAAAGLTSSPTNESTAHRFVLGIQQTYSSVTLFRWLVVMPPEGGIRAWILQGCPSLDRGSRKTGWLVHKPHTTSQTNSALGDLTHDSSGFASLLVDQSNNSNFTIHQKSTERTSVSWPHQNPIHLESDTSDLGLEQSVLSVQHQVEPRIERTDYPVQSATSVRSPGFAPDMTSTCMRSKLNLNTGSEARDASHTPNFHVLSGRESRLLEGNLASVARYVGELTGCVGASKVTTTNPSLSRSDNTRTPLLQQTKCERTTQLSEDLTSIAVDPFEQAHQVRHTSSLQSNIRGAYTSETQWSNLDSNWEREHHYGVHHALCVFGWRHCTIWRLTDFREVHAVSSYPNGRITHNGLLDSLPTLLAITAFSHSAEVCLWHGATRYTQALAIRQNSGITGIPKKCSRWSQQSIRFRMKPIVRAECEVWWAGKSKEAEGT